MGTVAGTGVQRLRLRLHHRVAHRAAETFGIYARGPDDYYFGYESAPFSEVMQALDAETDPQLRNALYGDAQRILGEDLAAIFLFQLAKTGVRSANLQGMWEKRARAGQRRDRGATGRSRSPEPRQRLARRAAHPGQRRSFWI